MISLPWSQGVDLREVEREENGGSVPGEGGEEERQGQGQGR